MYSYEIDEEIEDDDEVQLINTNSQSKNNLNVKYNLKFDPQHEISLISNAVKKQDNTTTFSTANMTNEEKKCDFQSALPCSNSHTKSCIAHNRNLQSVLDEINFCWSISMTVVLFFSAVCFYVLYHSIKTLIENKQ